LNSLDKNREARESLISQVTDIEQTRETIELWEDVLMKVDKGIENIDIDGIAAIKVSESNLDINLSKAIEEVIEITNNSEMDLALAIDIKKEDLYEKTQLLYNSQESIENLIFLNKYNEIAETNSPYNQVIENNVNINKAVLDNTFSLTPTTLNDYISEISANQLAVATLIDDGLMITDFKTIDDTLNKGYDYAKSNDLLDNFANNLSDIKSDFEIMKEEMLETDIDTQRILDLEVYNRKLDIIENSITHEIGATLDSSDDRHEFLEKEEEERAREEEEDEFSL